MSDLIEQYREMHKAPDMFEGFSILPHIFRIKRWIDEFGAKTGLDYGCGKASAYTWYFEVVEEGGDVPYNGLNEFFGTETTFYDPGYAPYSARPNDTYDYVVCTDVLEHMEDLQEAERAIQDLFNYAENFVFASVSCEPAQKTLPDGRNAHTCVHPKETWVDLFSKYATCDFELNCIKDGEIETFGTKLFDVERKELKYRQQVKVKTRNSIDVEEIASNIRYSQDRITEWAQKCHEHDKRLVIVSGGPSWKDHLDEIMLHYAHGDLVACVKHTHDALIEEGIIPWGCFLLDPRGHVKDFVENPHPETIYFTATQVAPSAIDKLLEKNARVVGYHAVVGAGEDKIARSGLLVQGGSTSTTRGISLMRSLGFRRYTIFGADSCYAEPQEGGMTVEVNGREFHTDAELIAQVQDYEDILARLVDCKFDIMGDGMVAEVAKAYGRKSEKLKNFKDLYLARPTQPRQVA